jgi:hypothetical protein
MSMRILFISANPKWEDRLELGDELRTLLGSLKGRDVDLMLLPAAQPEDLRVALGSADIDVVHFSGHAEEEGILLRDSDGYAQQVSGSELRNLLQDNGVKLAVLNACSTKATAEEIEETVGAVIGTTKKLDDRAANKLTKVLYASLGTGQSIDAAFNEATETIEHAKLPNVYIRAGKDVDALLFPEKADEDGKVRIEGQAPYDKFFYISYLDEQIRNLTGRVRLNRALFWILLAVGLVAGLWLWIDTPVAIKDVWSYVTEPKNWDKVFGAPLLDSLLALGAGVPALVSFFQARLLMQGNQELRSLKQMRELAKAFEDLTPDLQGRLQKILDQSISGADKNYEPLLDWFRISEKIIRFGARIRANLVESAASAPKAESAT